MTDSLDLTSISMVTAALLAWVALVHFVLAFGVRRGELVWSGRYPRLLTPEYRRRSLGYALFVLLSAWVLAAYGGVVELSPVPERWMRSAGWVITVFLGIAALYSFIRGTRWERLLLGPMALLGSLLAGWLTFG